VATRGVTHRRVQRRDSANIRATLKQDSDLIRPLFRHEAGRNSDLKPATIPR